MAEGVIESIMEVLEKERAAAIRADFEELARISIKKDKLFANLQADSIDPGSAQSVKQGLEDNQRIIAAVLAGVKSAQSFITDRADQTKKVSVYNEAGSIETVDGSEARSLERY